MVIFVKNHKYQSLFVSELHQINCKIKNILSETVFFILQVASLFSKLIFVFPNAFENF